jgi:cell wall-associated NlpC family hydrolase
MTQYSSYNNIRTATSGARLLKGSVFVLLMIFIVGCSSSRRVAISPEARLMQSYEQWKGTPYRLGGTTRSGVDCSAFVQIVMRDQFRIDLPRTTDQQLRTGRRVRRGSLNVGDLVFFRTGRSTLHVGIMLDRNRFMHASTSQGVMISSLNERYWSQRFIRGRRLSR